MCQGCGQSHPLYWGLKKSWDAVSSCLMMSSYWRGLLCSVEGGREGRERKGGERGREKSEEERKGVRGGGKEIEGGRGRGRGGRRGGKGE